MLNLKLSNLFCLRLCGRYSQKYGWDHAGKALENHMLVMLESGDCAFKINGNEIPLSKGDVIFIPKNTWYQPFTLKGCSYQYFHFDTDEADQAEVHADRGRAYSYCEPMEEETQILTIPRKSAADHRVREELSATIDEMRKDSQESHLKMHLHFFAALARLSECAREERETPADQVKKYIVDHALEKMTLADVAAHFGYTKQHVIRIFKARFHSTPNDFIDRCRLTHGMHLLSESNMTVEEIAHDSGFDDANYFARRFKKRFAISPAAYRAQLQNGI